MLAHQLLILERIKQYERLAKSAGAAQPKLTVIPRPPQRVGKAQPASTPHADLVRVQRPGVHEQPILARQVAKGKHGIVVVDERNQRMKIRHGHVLESPAAATPEERAAYWQNLGANGGDSSAMERFLLHDSTGTPTRRPTSHQIELLNHIKTMGVPLDLDHILKNATYNDVQDLLQQYIKDPTGRITGKRSWVKKP